MQIRVVHLEASPYRSNRLGRGPGHCGNGPQGSCRVFLQCPTDAITYLAGLHRAYLPVSTDSAVHRYDVERSDAPDSPYCLVREAAQRSNAPVRPIRIAHEDPPGGPAAIGDTEWQPMADIAPYGLDVRLLRRTKEANSYNGLAPEPASRFHPVTPIDHHEVVAPDDDRWPRVDTLHEQVHVALVQASRPNPLTDAEFGYEEFILATNPEADWRFKGNRHRIPQHSAPTDGPVAELVIRCIVYGVQQSVKSAPRITRAYSSAHRSAPRRRLKSRRKCGYRRCPEC